MSTNKAARIVSEDGKSGVATGANTPCESPRIPGDLRLTPHEIRDMCPIVPQDNFPEILGFGIKVGKSQYAKFSPLIEQAKQQAIAEFILENAPAEAEIERNLLGLKAEIEQAKREARGQALIEAGEVCRQKVEQAKVETRQKDTKTDKQLAQLFKRAVVDNKAIQNMPEEYIRGWYAGAVVGREAQRKTDIVVAKRLLES